MKSNTAQNDVYIRRINTVISHVRQNLDGDLSLDTLSRVGVLFEISFSPSFQIDYGRNCQRYGGTYAAGARGKFTSNGSETFHHCRRL